VERARRYLIGAWQIHQQTNGARLADLMDVLLVGEGLAELRSFEARIRRVSAEGMRAAAERWLDPARMVEGVVRGSGGGR
jgi:predicted Zn-dependent peptidase